jgi:uridine phosphorylase
MNIETLPITGLPVGKVSPAVMVCGDPARATQASRHLTDAVLLSEKREYRAYNGLFAGMPVTICSHGVGASGAAVAFEELIRAGARRIVRVGSCGGLQPAIQSGDLTVVTAAVDHTGYGRETVPPGYPAVADPELTLALREETIKSGRPFHSGIVITRDNFYQGVITPFTPDYAVLSEANVQAVEMECAALFIVGSLRRVPTAAILAVDGNVLVGGEQMETYNPHQNAVAEAIEAEIGIALRALRRLHDDAG